MPSFVIESGAPDIEEGTYDAVLTGIEEKSYEGADGTREFLVWSFDATIDNEVVEVDGASSKVFTPKAKAVEWMSAILQRIPQVGEGIDINRDLVGKPCRVLVAKNKNGYPRVEKVMAASRKARPVAAPAPAPEAPAPAPAPAKAEEDDLNSLPF